MTRELRSSGVGEDQLRAILHGVLEPRRRDGMVRHRIGADQQHDFGFQHVHHRIGHGARADAFEQCRHARRVAKPRAVIDVVRAEAGAHELLEQIRLLVAALRRAEACERVRPALIADAFKRPAGERERFLPRCFAEHFERIRGVGGETGRLREPRLADERLRQAMRVIDVIEAEATLDAQPLVIRGTVAPFDMDDPVFLDVVRDLAADAAVRTHRGDFRVDRAQKRLVGRRERACRAGLHAFAAGNARRQAHRIVQVEHDLRVRRAKRVADDVVHLLLAARAHATRALDAGVEVHRHRRVRHVGRGLRAAREARLADAELVLPVIELRVSLVRALGHVGREELDDHLLRMQRARGVARHFHPGRRLAAARRRQHALALDLDHARAAVAVGTVPGLVAEARYRYADAVGRFDDCFAGRREDFFAVEPKRDRGAGLAVARAHLRAQRGFRGPPSNLHIVRRIHSSSCGKYL